MSNRPSSSSDGLYGYSNPNAEITNEAHSEIRNITDYVDPVLYASILQEFRIVPEDDSLISAIKNFIIMLYNLEINCEALVRSLNDVQKELTIRNYDGKAYINMLSRNLSMFDYTKQGIFSTEPDTYQEMFLSDKLMEAYSNLAKELDTNHKYWFKCLTHSMFEATENFSTGVKSLN